MIDAIVDAHVSAPCFLRAPSTMLVTATWPNPNFNMLLRSMLPKPSIDEVKRNLEPEGESNKATGRGKTHPHSEYCHETPMWAEAKPAIALHLLSIVIFTLHN